MSNSATAFGGDDPGTPTVDQGSLYASVALMQAVLKSGARICLDGKGFWRHNVIMERVLAVGQEMIMMGVDLPVGAPAL